MNVAPRPGVIRSLAEVEALLGPVGEASVRKEVSFLSADYQAMVRAAPFAVLATAGPEGLDASPRGDAPGFVEVVDERTLHLPERRGNNRGDSLRNIVRDPRVALLFLIPGVGETLRVNGRAVVTIDPVLLARFQVDGKPPKCVIEIAVESVYFQCARALQRSSLWQPLPGGFERPVPTPGAMLQALTRAGIDGAAYDAGLAERQRATLY